jgi:putative ABC transport system permease protein
MLKDYCRSAWRSLLKYKFISFNHLLGSTIGLTSCLLIITYVRYDLSFRFGHPNCCKPLLVHSNLIDL